MLKLVTVATVLMLQTAVTVLTLVTVVTLLTLVTIVTVLTWAMRSYNKYGVWSSSGHLGVQC